MEGTWRLSQIYETTSRLVCSRVIGHNWSETIDDMTFYSCFDQQGKEIARCQTHQEIEALRRMGRPIAEVREMSNEEAVVCSLTSSPSDFNEDV